MLSKMIYNEKSELISPISLFDPCLSPIIASIEQDNFEITSLLLSHGVDPNSKTSFHEYETLHNTENSIDQNRTENLESKMPEFFTPLDLAISKRRERTVSLLITCGADVTQIDQSNVSINIQKQLDKYKIESSNQKKFDMNQIHNDTEEFAQKTKTILDELRQIKNFATTPITPTISKIKQHYSQAATNIEHIIEIAQQIIEQRAQYLKSQFDQLVNDDNLILNEQINKDKRHWIETYDKAITALQAQLHNEKTKRFAKECLQRIKHEKESFLQSSAFELEVDSNVEQNSYRIILLEYNSYLTELKQILNHMHSNIEMFHNQSIKTIDGFLIVMTQHLDTIHDVNDPNSNALKRLGFNDFAIEKIKAENASKERPLEETAQQLGDQKVLFETLFVKLRNCLLLYMR